MKKQISAILSLAITAGSLSLFPAAAADALLHADFESGLDGWGARGTASVAQITGTAASGTGAASVTERAESWCGIGLSLDPSIFKPGSAYSFSASVSQKASPMAVHFKLSLQYSTDSGGGFPFGGSETYDCIAECDAASGMWTKLSNPSYTIPADAKNPVLYIETADSKADFFVDEIVIAEEGGSVSTFSIGDADHSGSTDRKDVSALLNYLLTKSSDGIYADTADLDSSYSLTASDLTLLKRQLSAPKPLTTTAPPADPVTVTTTAGSTPDSGDHADPKEYMAMIRTNMTANVPQNVLQGDRGTLTKFSYYSKKAGIEKHANVWLPAGYSADKQYNVLYMNHGVFGNEDSMISGWGIREMASNMIESGEAEPFIIIFPQMYTSPKGESAGFGITQEAMDEYDDFLYDLTESLMPYVQEHWSVMTGKEHTAIAGFSMGGRESLYIGIQRPDLFGYVAASSPAPGIVPGKDMYLNHAGSYIPGTNQRMTDGDFKIADDKLPYLLMIAGGTADSVVGTFPEQYHNLFTQNGTEHIWTSVPGAGHDSVVGTPLFYNFYRALFKA